MEKLEWCGYLMVKTFEDVFSGVDKIAGYDGRTDRQTSCHSIVRATHMRRAVIKGIFLRLLINCFCKMAITIYCTI